MDHESSGKTRERPRLVSVVVPALNASEAIDDQLSALADQSYDAEWELIVADNGSSDDTPAKVSSWEGVLPRLRLVDASDRVGPGHARNVGVEAAKGDLIAFCDADDMVDSEWLSELVRESLYGDVVGGSVNESDGLPRIMGFLPHACGCSMTVWRDTFEAIGGFDERFLAGQDAEFSWRAQLCGYSLRFAADAAVHRRSRPNLRATWRQRFRYGYWGALLYREYRDRGVPKVSAADLLQRLGWLVLRIPYLAISKRRREIWVQRVAMSVGAVMGSCVHRVIYMP